MIWAWLSDTDYVNSKDLGKARGPGARVRQEDLGISTVNLAAKR